MATPNTIANQPLRVQVNEKPSYYNDEMLIGAGLGAVVPVVGGPIGAGIGAMIGAVIGEGRMRHEAEHGKEIKEPSFFNKGLAMGILAPVAAANLIVPLLGLAGVAVGVSMPSLIVAAFVAYAGALAITPVTAVVGAFSGKSEMAREKEQAISQLQNYAMGQHFGKSQEPELAQEMDAPSRQFAQMIEDQRLQAQGVKPQR